MLECNVLRSVASSVAGGFSPMFGSFIITQRFSTTIYSHILGYFDPKLRFCLVSDKNMLVRSETLWANFMLHSCFCGNAARSSGVLFAVPYCLNRWMERFVQQTSGDFSRTCFSAKAKFSYTVELKCGFIIPHSSKAHPPFFVLLSSFWDWCYWHMPVRSWTRRME